MDDLNIRNFMPFPFIAHKFRHEIKIDSGYNNQNHNLMLIWIQNYQNQKLNMYYQQKSFDRYKIAKSFLSQSV